MAVESGKNGRKRGAARFYRGLTGGRGRFAAGVLLVVLAAGYLALGEGGWEPVRREVFDAWQRMFPRQVSQYPVVIVDIDEESLAALGRWPWPRTRLARLAEAAHRLGAEAVGVDIIMPEPDSLSPEILLADRPEAAAEVAGALSRLPSNDELLVRTLASIRSVAARAALIDGKGIRQRAEDQTPVMIEGKSPVNFVTAYGGHLANIAPIEDAVFGCGYLNDTRDSDGVVRTMPLVIAVDGNLAPAMSVELLRAAAGVNWYTAVGGPGGLEALQVADRTIPTDPDGRIRLYFSPSFAGRRVSALSVLEGKVQPRAFTGQVALIGVTAVGVVDVVSTPVAARMDGVEIQAQVVENILEGARLRRPAHLFLLEVLFFAAAGVVLIAALPRLHPTAGAACFAGFAGVSAAASIGFFIRDRLLLDPSFAVAGNLLVFVVLLLFGVADARRRQKEAAAALEAEKLERERIAGELQAARKIQMGMLPDPGAVEGLPPRIDFFALLEPAEEVGGDLYDAFMIDERRFFFMVGDVAGKGVAASLFMALSKTLLKSTALRGDLSPAGLMEKVNRELTRENQAMLFVTAAAGILDAGTGTLRLCCAGHETPVLAGPGRAAQQVAVESGPPLCVLDGHRYAEAQVDLRPGDLLVLISDGITEAQDPAGGLYGRQRILEKIDALEKGGRRAERICRTLYEDVKSFAGGRGRSDDITVLAVGFGDFS